MKKHQILRRTALYAAATAIVTVGCKQNTPNPQEVSDTSIEFTVSLAGMPIEQSRAAGADVDLSILQTYGFYLAGYHTTGKVADAASDDLSPNVFSKVSSDLQDPVPLVSYTNNKFTLKTIKWQLDDLTYLGFFGWSQNKTIPTTGITATTTGIIGQTKNVDDKGFPWIEIRNADAPTDQTDVVGTRSIDHCNDAVISAVDLDFSHLLSKISFSAQSSSGAKVVISSAKIKYAADKVYKKARYTFGGSVETIGAYGAYAEYHTGSVALNSASVTVNGATPITLGSALLIPQALAAGDVSLELTYAISPNGTLVGTTQTKTLPLSAIALAQGNHYLYTIDLQATEIMLSLTPTIEPWSYMNTLLPLVAGPKGTTQLLLDGYEKPYQHTDGKWYWLDRSGYNRHVELGAGYVSYNVDKRGYVFNGSAAGGTSTTPTGTLSNFTVDLLCEHTSGGSYANASSPFKISTTSSLELAPNGSAIVWWRYPASNALSWSSASVADIDQQTYWSLVSNYSSDRAYVYKNASLVATSTNVVNSSSSPNNIVVSPSYAGRISYLRITTSVLSQTDIIANAKKLSDRFGGFTYYAPNPPTADQILTLNGLKWAKGNLIEKDEFNCKVGEPVDYGLYFHFGSLVGWNGGANGDGTGQGSPSTTQRVKPSGFGGNASWPTGYYTGGSSENTGYALPSTDEASTGIGDPCRYYLGSPWRTPTLVELLALFDNVSNGTSLPTANWSRVTSPYSGVQRTGNTLFFPASGCRYGHNGSFYGVGGSGYVWGSAVHSTSEGFGSLFNVTHFYPKANHTRAHGFPVRCVSGTYVPPPPPINPPTASDYVEIDGVKWAKGNLVAKNSNECKVGAPTDYGLYFQFGSLVGWTGGASGNGVGTGSPTLAVQVKPATYGGTDAWTTVGRYTDAGTAGTGNGLPGSDSPSTGIGDPCRYYLGAQWRTPTAAEYLTLLGASGANTNKAVPLKVNNYDLSFPASGLRGNSGGTFSSVGSYGYYWSSSVGSASHGYGLTLYSGSVNPYYNYDRFLGMPVRCVAK